MQKEVEVAIIGAGSAGLYALSQVKKETKDFVLIDGGTLGTTCARVGCMPSKALIHIANTYAAAKKFDDHGIKGAKELDISISGVLQKVRQLRDIFTGQNEKGVHKLGSRFISANARFIDAHTLRAGDATIKAKKIIIATGSTPRLQPAWERFSDKILTTDTFFEQNDLPAKVAVLGGGAIGLELGQALAKLGLDITLVHSRSMIAGLRDEKVNENAAAAVSKDLRLWRGSKATLRESGDRLTVETKEHSTEVDMVLAATGRVPNLANLDFEKTGLGVDARGIPRYDRNTMRIENSNIYLAGDVNAHLPLLHEAADEGRIAGFNAAAKPHSFGRKVPLSIVFSTPQIAVTGQVQDFSQETVTAYYDFSKQGRAILEDNASGMACLHARKSDGRILGAQIAAPEAEHLIHHLAWAVQQKMSVYSMLKLPFYHPTLEEGIRDLLKKAVKKIGRDKAGILEVRE